MNRLFLLLPLVLLFIGCDNAVKGEGDANLAQDFKIEPFTDVQAQGKFKLILIPNDSSYVSVQTHRNLIDNLEIYVQNRGLHIEEKEDVDSFESYVVYLYYNEEMDDISLSDKVLMESSSQLNFDNLDIAVSDEAMIKQFAINAKELDIEVIDKGEVEISGEATTLDLKAKDFAKVSLESLAVKVLDVDITGEADVMANASKELSGRVLENSTLKYIGNPQKNVDVKDNGEMINK